MSRLNKLKITYLIGSLAIPVTTVLAVVPGQQKPYLGNASAEKVIAYTKNGKLYKYELYSANSNVPAIVNQTSPEALPANVKKTTYSSLEAFEDSLNPASKVMAATADNSGKIMFGYTPSIQAIYQPTEPCYTSAAKVERDSTNIGLQSKLVITDAEASDTSLIFNSNSIAEGFKNPNNTYTNNYATEAPNGKYNLAAALTTVVKSGIQPTNNLTQYAKDLYAKDPVKFLNTCGSSGAVAYVGGILTTINIEIKSSTADAAFSFNTDVADGYSVDQVINAFRNSAKNNAKNFSKVYISVKTYGNIKFDQSQNNASDYQTYINKAVAANASNLDKCQTNKTPDLSACAIYVTNISNSVTAGIGYAKSALLNTKNAATLGADTLAPFPNGLNLTHNYEQKSFNYKNPLIDIGDNKRDSQIKYSNASSSGVSVSDPFAQNSSIAKYLKNSVRLVYQLNTLSERAKLLASINGLTTEDEVVFLNDLANLYANDASEIFMAANKCYNKVLATAPGDKITSGCTNWVRVANNRLTFSSDELPDNVYQLYGSNFPDTGSIQELLFQNSIALQYNTDYTETASGISIIDGANNMIRAANQINFGVAFFNRSLFQPEFFGGQGKQPAQIAGYIFTSVINPSLGTSLNEYKNSNDTQYGVKYWQLYQPENAIQGLKKYAAAPLYFVYNWPNLFPIQMSNSNKMSVNSPGGCNLNYNIYSCAIFNKVIAQNKTSADSSAITNQYLGLSSDRLNDANDLSKLIKGHPLAKFVYTGSGFVTTNNSQNNKAEECFAGVYIPYLQYPGKGREAVLAGTTTYGSINPLQYFCNANPDRDLKSDPYSQFMLSQDKLTAVKNLNQKTTFTLSPIPKFLE